MKKMIGWTVAFLILWTAQALAVTATGFAGDEIVARAYNSFTQVWSPVIALTALLGLIGALYTGHRIGSKVVGLIFIIVLLGGGLPYLSQWSGGSIAAGATLHVEQR